MYWSPGKEPFIRFRFWRDAKLISGHTDVSLSEIGRLLEDDTITFRHNYTGRDVGIKDEDHLSKQGNSGSL